MGLIQSYERDTNIHDEDLLMGTSYISLNKYESRKYRVKDFVGHVVQQVNTDPSNLSLKANGGIVRENGDLAIDLSATSITGQLANSDLANSSITINGTAVSLGGSITTPDTNTQLSTEQVQDIVGAMFSSNTETRIAATYQDSDGTIDLVVDNQTVVVNDSTANTYFPVVFHDESNGLLDDTGTFTYNPHYGNLRLPDNGRIHLGGNGSTSGGALYYDSSGAGATYLENYGSNHLVIRNLSDDGDITFKTDDGSGNTAEYLKIDGANTVITMANYDLQLKNIKIKDGTQFEQGNDGQVITSTGSGIQWEDIPSQTDNNFTTTLKNKLDGIAAGAEVNVNADWNSSSGDSEILNKPTIPSGNQIIDWTASGAGTIHASNYVDNDTIYTLPAASSSALGGIKIGYTESGKNYPVELDSNKAYVNVPWTDTVYSLPLAASGTRGGVKIGYSENGKNYPVELSSEKMYVNVPWTDTVYTLPVASSSLGGIKIGYTDNGKNYAVELDGDNEAYVNVPWTDTTYTLPTASSSTLGGVKVGGNLTIDNNGVLNVGAIALTTVQTAANETAHLNLTAQEGDIVVRSDENKSYVRNSGTAGTMADYTELLTPTDAVLSVTTTDGTYINLTPNSATTGAINIGADLSAADGTADNTARFLTKDNTWAVPAYTTDTNTQLTTAQVRAKFTAGTNITITNGEISATDTDTNTFRTVKVDTSGNGTADNTLTATEDLMLKKGSNITLAEADGVVTISSTDTNTTYDIMGSGNTYAAGLVLAGSATHGGAFLRKDGSWQVPPDTNTNTTYSAGTGLSLSSTTFNINVDGTNTEAAQNSTTTSGRTYKVQVDSSDNLVVNVPWVDTDTNTDTNTTYDLSVPASTTKIRLAGSDSTNDDVEIAAGTNVTVTRNATGNKLTIASTDTNTQRSDESIRDVVAAMLTAGTNISLSEDDANDTLTITSTDTNTDTIDMGDGFTVSADTDTATTTITENDTLTIAGGTNVSTVSNPDGTITINATDTNTTYSAATSSALGLIKIGYSESGKNYPVELDGSNKAYVNVPWTDTDTNTTYSTATSSTLGLVKIGYSENGKNYPVELSNGQMFVNVPWTDTNTNVTNHITNNADDTATGVYSFTNTGNHKFGAGGNGNIYVGNVISASAADKGFRIHSNNADVYFDYRTDSTGSHFYRQYDGSGGIHTRFEHDITSGVFRASSDIVAYYSFSDIRLKENIKPTNYGLNELLKLNPVEFKWKEKDGKEIGLIAQEVEEIVPEVIKENKRINDDTLYKQVDYEKLVPVLINSIKELNERIKKLEDGSTN